MCCIICHNNPILNLNPKTQARKGLIIHNIMNGIATLRKHVNFLNSDFFFFFKNFEEKVNFLLREKERQPSKNRPNISSNSIFIFFYKRTFQEKGCVTKTIFEGLGSFNCQKPSSFTICGE